MAKAAVRKKAVIPDKDFQTAFDKYFSEYFEKRSLEGLLACLDEQITVIGSALHELAFKYNDVAEAFKKDIEQVSSPVKILDRNFELRRINDETAIIAGQCRLQSKTAGQDFEIADFRISAVLKACKDLIKLVHLHCSMPQYNPGEPQSFPIRLLQNSLHETSEKYRLIFEHAPVGILRFDENGVVKECNRKFLQIMNSTAEKVIGMKMLKLEDRQAAEAINAALCGRNGFYEGYYRAVTSGKLVPLKAMISPIFGPDASVTGGLGIYEDIGETKIAESKLHYQFQFEKIIATISSSFVNTSRDSIDTVIVNAIRLTARFFNAERGYVFQINPDRKTARGTHEWEENGVPSIMHKYTCIDLEALEGMGGFIDRLLDHIHIPDINKFPPELEAIRHILTAWDVKSVLVLPLVSEGRLIGCFGYDCINNARSWTYEEITLLKVVGEIFSNILSKQAAENKLQESEEKYRLLAENANDVIWIADLDENRFKYMSPATEKLYGMPAEEVAGEPLHGRLTPEAKIYFETCINERVPLIGKEANLRYIDEAFQIHKDGRIIPTEVTTNWIKDPNNGHVLIIGVTRDITLRKQAEEQRALLEMQKLQNQKADSLGRMAGAIAHHFNNQLQVVIGNIELLNSELQGNAILRKRLSDAMRATNKAAELSSLMLSYLGQTQSKVEKIDLVQACQVQQTLLQDLCPENIKLTLEFSSKNLNVNADPSHLQQIMRNVVTNSVEAIGSSKGQITISLKTITALQIPSNYRLPIEWRPTAENYACLEISDNGCGIQPQDMDRIFDPFFSNKFTGRGLGLAVSLGFMRSMGGATSFRSKPGKGSTFSFYFSINEQVINDEEPASRVEKQSADGAVLLVEDEDMVRFITSNLLEHYNFKVLEARNGEEAVKIFSRNKDNIRLIICDLLMPGIDGWQTIEEIRKIVPDIPVILASGYDQTYVMKGSHKELPNAYLSKPYGAKALQKAIKEAFGRE